MGLEQTINSAREYLDPRSVDCVIYHSPCQDGSGAALSAWLLLGEGAVYEKLAYHAPFNEEVVRGRRAVFLDCSVRRDELQRLRQVAAKVLVLDHHVSAQEDLRGVDGCCFCMEHSGAVLAWYYFHGLESACPYLLRLIEDRDLWRWDDRSASESVYYGLAERNPRCEFRDYVQYLEDDALQSLIRYGASLQVQNNEWCIATASKVQLKQLTVPGDPKLYHVACIELESNKLISELAEHLYSKYDVDFTMLWFRLGDKYKISFRTNKDGIDLSIIAGRFGGGGHKRAAGASLLHNPWELFR